MAECRSCGTEIRWAAHHNSGNAMPLEEATEEQVEDGRGLWLIRDVEGTSTAFPAKTEDATGMFPVQLYVSHFSTCPDSGEWRRS